MPSVSSVRNLRIFDDHDAAGVLVKIGSGGVVLLRDEFDVGAVSNSANFVLIQAG